MVDVISRVAMIFGLISAINITDINDSLKNPMFWICLICIGILYVVQGVKNDH